MNLLWSCRLYSKCSWCAVLERECKVSQVVFRFLQLWHFKLLWPGALRTRCEAKRKHAGSLCTKHECCERTETIRQTGRENKLVPIKTSLGVISLSTLEPQHQIDSSTHVRPIVSLKIPLRHVQMRPRVLSEQLHAKSVVSRHASWPEQRHGLVFKRLRMCTFCSWNMPSDHLLLDRPVDVCTFILFC